MSMRKSSLALAVAFALAGPSAALAQQKLKFAHVYETSEPYHSAAVWAAGEIAKRKLHLHVDAKELEARRKTWKPPKPPMTRGYWKLYVDHVLQADQGADLDFLVGKSGPFVPRDNH